MKNFLLLAFSMFFLNSYAQDTTFRLSPDGFTDYIVVSVPEKSQQELYAYAYEWALKTYIDPDEAIKAKVENDYIRIMGVQQNLMKLNFGMMGQGGYLTRYQLEISFKDGRYKFDVSQIEYYTDPSQYSAGGWVFLNVDDTQAYYKDSGKFKNMYKYLDDIPQYFNDLNQDLLDYINSGNKSEGEDDW